MSLVWLSRAPNGSSSSRNLGPLRAPARSPRACVHAAGSCLGLLILETLADPAAMKRSLIRVLLRGPRTSREAELDVAADESQETRIALETTPAVGAGPRSARRRALTRRSMVSLIPAPSRKQGGLAAPDRSHNGDDVGLSATSRLMGRSASVGAPSGSRREGLADSADLETAPRSKLQANITGFACLNQEVDASRPGRLSDACDCGRRHQRLSVGEQSGRCRVGAYQRGR